ncbi:MAG: DNA circularization N-terminal domain-containing protein [Thiotrichales bacterium]|nr:DNA circularization N-terminal domain-containing protein [Thiotrichales bacterium]
MWDREFDRASWNGVPVNLLKTSIERGKRVNVQNLPYSDEPFVEVMGEESRSYKFDAIFVGKDSLGQASAFIAALSSEPEGTLEHPYLGELELIYTKSSQSFSTKQGEVILSLEFLMKGLPITLPATYSKSVDGLTAEADEWAMLDFSEAMKGLPLDEINKIKDKLDAFVGKLNKLSSQLQMPITVLGQIQTKIQSALGAVASIANAPRSFASALFASVNGLVSGITSSLGGIAYGVTGNAPKASRDMLSAFRSSPSSATSDPADRLIKASSFSALLRLSPQLLVTMDAQNEKSLIAAIEPIGGIAVAEMAIKQLSILADELIDEATRSASSDSIGLVESLLAIKAELNTQLKKLDAAFLASVSVMAVSPTPVYVLAQRYDADLTRISCINDVDHPLFVNGEVRL